jgi:hypothetical protein
MSGRKVGRCPPQEGLYVRKVGTSFRKSDTKISDAKTKKEFAMKPRGWMVALALLGTSTLLASAQDFKPANGNEYLPRLGDIMSAAQMRHQKLWFAGKAQNWQLAAFELRQLKANLADAAVLYSDIPVNHVTTMEGPLQAVSDAITDRDGRKFAKAVGDLTEGCNSCHRSVDRGFIVMRIPADQQLFSNQLFSLPGKP